MRCDQKPGVRFLEARCEVFGNMGKWPETMLLGCTLRFRSIVGVSPVSGFDIRYVGVRYEVRGVIRGHA